jgi:hypothetical protein
MKSIKNELKNADDLTMAENMDFKNINYAEKFCNIVINGIQEMIL